MRISSQPAVQITVGRSLTAASSESGTSFGNALLASSVEHGGKLQNGRSSSSTSKRGVSRDDSDPKATESLTSVSTTTQAPPLQGSDIPLPPSIVQWPAGFFNGVGDVIPPTSKSDGNSKSSVTPNTVDQAIATAGSVLLSQSPVQASRNFDMRDSLEGEDSSQLPAPVLADDAQSVVDTSTLENVSQPDVLLSGEATSLLPPSKNMESRQEKWSTSAAVHSATETTHEHVKEETKEIIASTLATPNLTTLPGVVSSTLDGANYPGLLGGPPQTGNQDLSAVPLTIPLQNVIMPSLNRVGHPRVTDVPDKRYSPNSPLASNSAGSFSDTISSSSSSGAALDIDLDNTQKTKTQSSPVQEVSAGDTSISRADLLLLPMPLNLAVPTAYTEVRNQVSVLSPPSPANKEFLNQDSHSSKSRFSFDDTSDSMTRSNPDTQLSGLASISLSSVKPSISSLRFANESGRPTDRQESGNSSSDKQIEQTVSTQVPILNDPSQELGSAKSKSDVTTSAKYFDSPNAESPSSQLVKNAQLIQSIHQSDMRLGMYSADFGKISINTSLNHESLSAQISIDHAELSRALAVHLPSIEEKLGEAYGIHAKVEVRDSSNSMNGGSSQQQSGSDHKGVLDNHQGSDSRSRSVQNIRQITATRAGNASPLSSVLESSDLRLDIRI